MLIILNIINETLMIYLKNSENKDNIKDRVFLVYLYFKHTNCNIYKVLNLKWIDLHHFLLNNKELLLNNKELVKIILNLNVLHKNPNAFVLTNLGKPNKPISRYKYISLVNKYFYGKQ